MPAPWTAGIRAAVTTSKPTVVSEVNDSADITAILTVLPNNPKPGELVTFDTTLGNLRVNNGTPATSVEATTDSACKATVRFVETGTTRTATVRARHTASGAQFDRHGGRHGHPADHLPDDPVRRAGLHHHGSEGLRLQRAGPDHLQGH